MGNAESTLAFKNQFNILCTQSDISTKDPMWQGLLNTCVDHHQVFGILSIADVRRIRESHPENLENLLAVLVQHVTSLIKPSGIGAALEEQILCCLRALERIIPVIYEKRAYAESIQRFLWGIEGTLRVLIDSIIRLAQLPGFCVPLQGSSLWAAGVAASACSQHTKQNQYNKVELLRLLLTVIGEPLYCIRPHGIEHLAEKDPNSVAFLFCSLLNTGIQTTSFLPLGNSRLSDLALVTLLHLIVYHGNVNCFRKLLAKLHREDDFKVLSERLTQGVLNLPSASLLWELLQANRNFKCVPAEAIVNEILAKQYDRREDDFVKILTFILIHQSANLQWCSENTRAMGRLYVPFNEATVHIPAILDLLYNISPLIQLESEEQTDQFVKFAHSIMISKNKEYKMSLAASICNMLKENKLLIFKLKDLKDTGNDWLDKYFLCVREGNPSIYQQVEIPPMQNPHKFQSIQFHWDAPKIRWYSSALWGYAMQCGEIHTGVTPWTQTDIQLFKVETVPNRPTLRNPQGAVEAFGSMLWGFIKRD